MRFGCFGARETARLCAPSTPTLLPFRVRVPAGSHRAHNAAHGTEYKSIKVEVAEGEAARDVWICRCGHSKNKPFCDGSHKKIKAVPL